MEETFETFVQRERARLHGEREAIFAQQQELKNKLAAMNGELRAIEAYEAARSGKAPARASARSGTRRAPRGSRRDELLTLIKNHKGVTRGEILELLGAKGNKAAEMSCSNALTALTKSGQITRGEGRKYQAA
jgi:hypothetical protein